MVPWRCCPLRLPGGMTRALELSTLGFWHRLTRSVYPMPYRVAGSGSDACDWSQPLCTEGYPERGRVFARKFLVDRAPAAAIMMGDSAQEVGVIHSTFARILRL